MSRWEDLCTRCGLCCREKVRLDRHSYLLRKASCVHLDPDSGLCTSYDRRFTLGVGCRKMTIFRAMFTPWLPPGCGYVAWAKAHHIRFARRVEWIIEP